MAANILGKISSRAQTSEMTGQHGTPNIRQRTLRVQSQEEIRSHFESRIGRLPRRSVCEGGLDIGRLREMPRNELTAPLTFQPIFFERIWGGRRLESEFHKKLSPQKRVGESWEIVDRCEV